LKSWTANPLLPFLDEVMEEGMVTVKKVCVLRYEGQDEKQ
jgi:hypothetical protein